MAAQHSKTVAVVIPAYDSQSTIAACLSALEGQTFAPVEIIVVDSSPHTLVATIIQNQFPGIRLIRSQDRLLPHAARNLGAEQATGELLAFTDPDIYPALNWLEVMLAGHGAHGGAIVGAIEAHNRDWRGQSIHMGKFDLFLPGGSTRPTQLVMTGSLLLERALLQSLGGFDGSEVLGDLMLSWALDERGVCMTFVPSALVYHDHQSSARSYLRERFVRGSDYARLRAKREAWGVSRTAVHLLLTLAPFRLAGLVWRAGVNAAHAGQLPTYLLALPWVVFGQSAWLAGESMALFKRLAARSRPSASVCGS